LINDEAIRENGDEDLNLAGIVDISDEMKPRLISLLPLPEPPRESGLKNFYEKAGRFGPHNHHHPNHQACLENRDDIAYLTYFNAGVRVYDIRDARMPKEFAYFVPPDPKKRLGPKPSKLVAQTEDVLVDRRGFIYISDKNLGLHTALEERVAVSNCVMQADGDHECSSLSAFLCHTLCKQVILRSSATKICFETF
jgi:hypothetical protein